MQDCSADKNSTFHFVSAVLSPAASTVYFVCVEAQSTQWGHLLYTEYFYSKTFQSQRKDRKQGPVVQSVVSLTSALRVISLTVLADSIYNILIFLAEKM